MSKKIDKREFEAVFPKASPIEEIEKDIIEMRQDEVSEIKKEGYEISRLPDGKLEVRFIKMIWKEVDNTPVEVPEESDRDMSELFEVEVKPTDPTNSATVEAVGIVSGDKRIDGKFGVDGVIHG